MVFLLCAPLFAQQDGHSLTLDVVVNDKSGNAIPGVQAEDFTLLDNKQAQKITSFRAVDGAAADPPVELVFVVDEVNASFIAVAQARERLTKYFEQNGGKLPAPGSVVFFSDSGTTIGKPSPDGTVLAAELKQNLNAQRTIRRSQGFYGAQDRLTLSLRAMEELAAFEAPRPGRKLAIWISPGWPLLSGPGVQLTEKDQQKLFRTVVGLSDKLRQARITLNAVDPLGTNDAGGFRTLYYQEFLKGVTKPSHVAIGNLGLQVLAYQTGGQVLNSNNDVAGEIADCVSDLAHFYVLTFDSAGADGPDDYHALELKIDKPGLAARTRRGYYAQPESKGYGAK